jgi:hypothetical protein
LRPATEEAGVTARIDGALARQLEFGASQALRQSQQALRLVPAWRSLRGPDKYKVLAHRRHQAQIHARRVLDSAEEVQ